jgi:hypothetical protein
MEGKPLSGSYAAELLKEEAKHEAEKQAIIEEFTVKLKEEWSADDIKEKLEQLMPEAYASLKHLIQFAESEAVRAGLIKYIFNIALQQLAPGGDADPDNALQKLLEELRTN